MRSIGGIPCRAPRHDLRHIPFELSSPRLATPTASRLSDEDVKRLLTSFDASAPCGCRDRAIVVCLATLGLRPQEVAALCLDDIDWRSGVLLRLQGKGRKERVVPLWKSTAAQRRKWMLRIDRRADAPVFPNRAGKRMSRSGVQHRLRCALPRASERCPSLGARRISPHTLRHTTAMHLLQSGVDITVIALWLGHEDPATTHLYVEPT